MEMQASLVAVTLAVHTIPLSVGEEGVEGEEGEQLPSFLAAPPLSSLLRALQQQQQQEEEELAVCLPSSSPPLLCGTRPLSEQHCRLLPKEWQGAAALLLPLALQLSSLLSSLSVALWHLCLLQAWGASSSIPLFSFSSPLLSSQTLLSRRKSPSPFLLLPFFLLRQFIPCPSETSSPLSLSSVLSERLLFPPSSVLSCTFPFCFETMIPHIREETAVLLVMQFMSCHRAAHERKRGPVAMPAVHLRTQRSLCVP